MRNLIQIKLIIISDHRKNYADILKNGKKTVSKKRVPNSSARGEGNVEKPTERRLRLF
jgi:hypothetical protein